MRAGIQAEEILDHIEAELAHSELLRSQLQDVYNGMFDKLQAANTALVEAKTEADKNYKWAQKEHDEYESYMRAYMRVDKELTAAKTELDKWKAHYFESEECGIQMQAERDAAYKAVMDMSEEIGRLAGWEWMGFDYYDDVIAKAREAAKK